MANEGSLRALGGAPAKRDLATTVLGRPVSMPVICSAVYPDGEVAVARAASRGTAVGLSSFGSKPVEEVVAASKHPRPRPAKPPRITPATPGATRAHRAGRRESPLARQASDRRNHRNRMTPAHPPWRDARMHTTGHARHAKETRCLTTSAPTTSSSPAMTGAWT